MRIIYIDSLFLLNLMLDYLVLLLTGKLAGVSIRRPRLLAGSALGAGYAAALFLPGLSPLGHPVIRVGVGVLMVLIAYGGAQRLLRTVLLFFAAAALMGGGIFGLSLLGTGFDLEAGVPVPRIDLKLVLLGGAAAYCVLSLVGRKMARHGPRELRRVVISLDGKQARLAALVDNGNTLTDPMTGKPVLVAEGASLVGLLPPEADYKNPTACFSRLNDPRQFRLLPYRTVGVERGLLLAVRADRITVEGRETGNRLVALSPTPVSDGGGYQALLYEE